MSGKRLRKCRRSCPGYRAAYDQATGSEAMSWRRTSGPTHTSISRRGSRHATRPAPSFLRFAKNADRVKFEGYRLALVQADGTRNQQEGLNYL